MSEGDSVRGPYCGNCEASLNGGNSAKSIHSTREGQGGVDKDIPIYEALAVIFEIAPLGPGGGRTKKDVYESEGSMFEGGGDYGLCYSCKETLTALYEAYQKFTASCKAASEIGRRLRELEEERRGTGEEKEVTTKTRKLSLENIVVKVEREETEEDAENFDLDYEPALDEVVKRQPASPPSDYAEDDSFAVPGSGSPAGSENLSERASDEENFPRRSERRRARRILSDFVENENSEDEDVQPKATTSADNPLQCRKCSKEFLFETTLICHRRIIHHENITTLPHPIPRSQPMFSSTGGKTSTCPICRLIVPREDIRLHLSTHTRSSMKPWLCIVCGREFKNQQELHSHAETHKASIPCQYCKKSVPRLELLAHIRLCLTSRLNRQPNRSIVRKPSPAKTVVRWSCQLCGIKFARKDWMISHMATHKQAKRHPCKICDKRFDRADLLRLHVKRFHRNNEGPPSVLPATSAGVDMVVEDDNDNVSIPEASEPGPEKRTEKGTSSDGQKIEPMKVNRFVCKTCDLDFPKNGLLESHLMQLHADLENSTCKICSRKLQDTFCLTLHMKSHTENKPFVCFVCDKNYREKTNFFYHLKEKHELEEGFIVKKYPDVFSPQARYELKKMRGEMLFKVPPKKGQFPCEICGKVFSYNHAVLKHKKHVHDNIREFICSYCGKSFARKSYFLTHERLHTSTETPYKCHLCGKGFRLPGNLRGHLKSSIHNDSRDFICETCGKGFNRRENLRLHVNSVHLKLPSRRVPRSRDRANAMYTTGGRRRIYGADLPVAPESVSGLSMPILSQETDTTFETASSSSSSQSVIVSQSQSQIQQNNVEIPHSSYSQADFTMQQGQLFRSFSSFR